MDSSSDAFGPDYLSLIAGPPGQIQVRVEPLSAAAPLAPYTSWLLQQRPAQPADEQQAAPAGALTEATPCTWRSTGSWAAAARTFPKS